MSYEEIWIDVGMDAEAALRALGAIGAELELVGKASASAGGSFQALEASLKSGEVPKGAKAFAALSEEALGAYRALRTAGKQLSGALEAVGAALDSAGRSAGALGASSAEATKKLAVMERQAAGAAGRVNTLGEAAARVQPRLNVSGSAKFSVTGAVASAVLLGGALTAVSRLMGETTKAASRSGGGSSRARRAAKEAALLAEELRKESIRKDYELIAHKRHMNEITLEQELKMLEQIRQKHRLNAEEIMEWEEKIYDLKKEMRKRDADSLDNLGDSVMDALEARYRKMLDAETRRLEQSREAWERWRDDSVKAIEDQIAALDALARAEDQEKQDQEELRKIAKLRQDIEYEQDEFSRAKLRQQLEQTLSDREDRLRRQALEAQKNALRQEIEGIHQRADAEQALLDQEQKALEEAYAQRMESAALQAEAEKLMMTQSQDQLLGLLAEYAPAYDALGKTLGEKLLEGFQEKVGSIVDWFKAFNGAMAAVQENIAAEAVSAAAAFDAAYQDRQMSEAAAPPVTVVNQTVNFNEPVETAADAARRIAQTNEELGALLYGG